MGEDLRKQILEQLRLLPAKQQRRVLEFARSLGRSSVRGVPGKQLLPFAGTIPAEDLQRMSAAIEEACERVDPDEW